MRTITAIDQQRPRGSLLGSVLCLLIMFLTCGLISTAFAAQSKKATPTPIPGNPAYVASLSLSEETTQLIEVEWTGGSNAQLRLWQKQDDNWQETLSTSAYVGRKGIGKEKEGDGKTPSGLYNLSQAFGIQKDPGSKLPYHVLTNGEYWVSNVKSEYYNTLVDTKETKYKPTKADEHLRAVKTAYDYCIVIDYNAECVPGKGSAIFLHCSGKKKSTSGCIAIKKDLMIQLLQTLEPGAMIMIH